MTRQHLTITAEDSGQRLDVFLAAKLGKSRSLWQREIKLGNILINQSHTKPSYLTETTDAVIINHNLQDSTPPSTPPQLSIVYQDSHLLVVEKPAGLLVHPVPGHQSEPTLTQFAALHTKDTDPDRPGIVHRLDRETSGLIIIAKDAPTKHYLQDQFRRRKVKKTYLLLVEGHLKQADALIDLPIGRKKDSAKRSVLPTGKPAQTHYQVLREYEYCTLVEAHPQTGRTHQLRVHFAHLGHPLVGDGLYGHAPQPNLGRLFLHASELEFTSPDGRILKLQSPLPDPLQQFLHSFETAV